MSPEPVAPINKSMPRTLFEALLAVAALSCLGFAVLFMVFSVVLLALDAALAVLR